MADTTICIYSQNISGDMHSEELIKIKGMEEMTFEKRFDKVVRNITPEVDVVAINEVRYSERVEFIRSKLEKEGFGHIKEFRNNDTEKTFHNMLAVRTNKSKSPKWCFDKWEHKWVAIDKEPYMCDKFATIEGDPHGRCAGLVYLHHKEKRNVKVCVAVSHVVPFGDVKKVQQNALFSISRKNSALSLPTILVGDYNRFPEEEESFLKQLDFYNVLEAIPSKLVIPGIDPIETPEDIGTFTPWPNDRMYEAKIGHPMRESRLDLHAYTNNAKLIKLKSCRVQASMFSTPGPVTGTDKYNKVRYCLDRRMASDHLAIISSFEVLG